MNNQDAFLEFIGNLEYLRKHQKLSPDAANAILSGVPLTIYAGQEGSSECAKIKAEAQAEAPAQGGAGGPTKAPDTTAATSTSVQGNA